MQEAYVLTPIMVHSTPDDWIERIAKRKGEKDLKKLLKDSLLQKILKSGLHATQNIKLKWLLNIPERMLLKSFTVSHWQRA